MDALSQTLNAVRMTGAIFFNAEFTAPWGFTTPSAPKVAPFLGLEIALTDDLRFALEGSRVSLEQRLSPAWRLRGEVNYESRQFRLNSDNPLPRGVFRDERIDAHGALVWRSSSGCELELGL
ncbi:MAG: hypothetical protein ABI478_13380, partial [Propionivibrio sp.]